jgi:hypothetical protein
MTNRGNLFHDYPKAFLDHWEGCAHQHCLAQCSSEPRHCERLRIAFEAWTKAETKETAT